MTNPKPTTDPHPAAAPDAGEQQEIIQRITSWLMAGGLFNPGLTATANEDTTRQLMFDARAALELAHPAHQERTEPTTLARAEVLKIANDRLTAAVHDVRVRKEFWDADAYRVHVQNNPEWQLSEFDVQFYGAVVRELAAPARAAEWQPQHVLDAFPTSWLDPLLTGPDAVVGNPPFWCPDVERLLAAVKERVEKLLPPCALTGNSK